jgi:ABC-type phosphate/phosphonate transport system ATPase subunit
LDQERATILRLQRVGMRYGAGEPVLREVDLTLAAGSFHFLVGPSGAGKTSLFRLISLSHPATHGIITLFGRDVSALDRHGESGLRRRIGVVFGTSADHIEISTYLQLVSGSISLLPIFLPTLHACKATAGVADVRERRSRIPLSRGTAARRPPPAARRPPFGVECRPSPAHS